MLCEMCYKREATNRTRFIKGIPSHIGAKLEAMMNLCDECREKVKAKATVFTSTNHLEKYFD